MLLSSFVNILPNLSHNILDLDVNYLALSKENCIALQFFLIEQIKSVCKDAGIEIADICYIQGSIGYHGKYHTRNFLDKDDALHIMLDTAFSLSTKDEITNIVKSLLHKICEIILRGLNEPHDLFILAGLNEVNEIEISLCVVKTKKELDSMIKGLKEDELEYKVVATGVALADAK